MTDDELRLLSLREAGEVLGLDWKAVRDLVETGEIGAYFTGSSRQPRIPRRSLVAWQDRIANRASLLSNSLSNPAPTRRRTPPRPTDIPRLPGARKALP